MKTTRRGFVKTLSLGTAMGMLGQSMVLNKATAQSRAAHASGVFDNGVMQLNQNESARGPGEKVLETIRQYTSKRVGRGYSPDHVNELRDALADYYGLNRDGVLLATGSTPLLEGAVHAFCSRGKPLVTATPTYATSANTARRHGIPVVDVVLDDSLSIDLEAMINASTGAGLVYFCNPNNPSGTVHGPAAVENFVRRIMAASPATRILIDEAYINYADPALMQSALPLVKEFPNVFITRSFSKAHGIAGLRVGYGLGHADTLDAIDRAWGMGDVNMLGAIAALTAFEDTAHLEWERQENAEIRAMVTGAFRDMGFMVPESQTNHLFVNLRRPAREFRAACLERNILVGRDFPPMENTHSRISLGSREEMSKAIEVFRSVLT